MKLDTQKAFKSLEWNFLFAVLEQFGFGPQFLSYICATTVGAASTVLINGRFIETFPISWSIRQGCPLSAILFAIVMDILSNQITVAIRERHI